jgi:hypothetical protein
MWRDRRVKGKSVLNLCRPSGACLWGPDTRGLTPPANFGLALRANEAPDFVGVLITRGAKE